jgi:glycosyltransferase involved in cell wall biosynthesis
MKPGVKDLEVFVLTYNRAHFLQQTLTSLCNQTVGGFRIVVLDNGSTDNTPEIIKNFEPSGVELCRSEQNLGATWNFNRAKALASRKWVMVFHDDDLLHPNYIEVAMDLISEHQDTVLIGSAMTFEEAPENNFWRELSNEAIKCERASDFAALLYRGFPFHFASTIYRTDLLKSIPYPYEYGIYGKVEDRPILFDIARHGAVLVLKAPYVKYRVHSGQGSADNKSGPFAHQLIALHRKYLQLLGSNPFTSSGIAFITRNYMYLCDDYTRLIERDRLTEDQYIKMAIEGGATTRLAIWYGEFIYNTACRAINKVVRFIFKKLKSMVI